MGRGMKTTHHRLVFFSSLCRAISEYVCVCVCFVYDRELKVVDLYAHFAFCLPFLFLLSDACVWVVFEYCFSHVSARHLSVAWVFSVYADVHLWNSIRFEWFKRLSSSSSFVQLIVVLVLCFFCCKQYCLWPVVVHSGSCRVPSVTVRLQTNMHEYTTCSILIKFIWTTEAILNRSSQLLYRKNYDDQFNVWWCLLSVNYR